MLLDKIFHWQQAWQNMSQMSEKHILWQGGRGNP